MRKSEFAVRFYISRRGNRVDEGAGGRYQLPSLPDFVYLSHGLWHQPSSLGDRLSQILTPLPTSRPRWRTTFIGSGAPGERAPWAPPSPSWSRATPSTLAISSRSSRRQGSRCRMRLQRSLRTRAVAAAARVVQGVAAAAVVVDADEA